MKIENQQTLPASQARAWEALNDIAILQACIPGCESLQETGDGHYELVVLAAVGPVKARFKGKLALSNRVAPQSYDLQFEGQGGVAGHGKGSASVRLAPLGADETVLHYSATATVGGKIAQIGQRLVDMAAQRMAAEFFANFDRQLRPPEPAQQSATAPSLWVRLTGKGAGDAPTP